MSFATSAADTPRSGRSRLWLIAGTLLALTFVWQALAGGRPSAVAIFATGPNRTAERAADRAVRRRSAANMSREVAQRRHAELLAHRSVPAPRYAGQPPGVEMVSVPSYTDTTSWEWVVVRTGNVSLRSKTRDAFIAAGASDPCSRDQDCDGVGLRDFRRVAFAVLCDPDSWQRVHAMLTSWLSVRTFGIFLCFDAAKSHAAHDLLSTEPSFREVMNRSGAEIVFLDDTTNVTGSRTPQNGAWKNIPAVRFLQQRHSSARVSPEWYCIVDDDSFVVGPNVARHLRRAEVQSAGGTKAVYLGHHVLRCPYCRTKAKQYWFVYGGNGIFLNRAALMTRLRAPSPTNRTLTVIADCEARHALGAGDERLGGCLKDAEVPVTRVEGGCEGYLAALAEGAMEFVAGSDYPFAFHRIQRPVLAHALWHLVQRTVANDALGPWEGLLTWPTIATWFLLPSRPACERLPLFGVVVAPPKEHRGHRQQLFDEQRCLPVDATPADWYPKKFDPKMRSLEAYAKAKRERLLAFVPSLKPRNRII